MYRTRKFRKNGGTNKKNPANTKSSKRRQQKKRQSKKARGPGFNSTETYKYGDEHREWGNSEASPRTMRRLRGQTSPRTMRQPREQFDEASDLMDQYGEASPTELARMRPAPPPRRRDNNKVKIGLTGAALVTIAALLANSKDASTPVPPPPPVKFEEAQSQILKSINTRLTEKDVSSAQKKDMRKAADILRARPQQGTYSSDPSLKAKSEEAEREKEKQYNEAMKQLRRRRMKGKPLPNGPKWDKFRPKPLKLA